MPTQTSRGEIRRRSPWLFVPPLYFLQAIPYFLVDTVPTTFFAALGVDLADIGVAAGLLALPWTLKPLWSPLVDLVSTKRAWTLAMQAGVLAATLALALAARSPSAVLWTTCACFGMALASATHDIAADGFYLLALDTRAQAVFVGIRNTCFRLGWLFVTGGVVIAAGALEETGIETARAWAYAFAGAGAVYAVGLAVCAFALPRPPSDVPRPRTGPRKASLALDAVASYFRRPGIAGILAFILLYRFGESMLTTMARPFLLRPLAEGGLALTTREVGVYSGTVGVLALLAGGILGGWLVARAGLWRCLWPMALAMNVPNLLYAWAAYSPPTPLAVAGIIAVEQLGYGFGFAAFMVVLMRVSQGRGFETTHYAISTGLMALSAMLARPASGFLAAALGFGPLFLLVCAFGLPSLATLRMLPRDLEAEPA